MFMGCMFNYSGSVNTQDACSNLACNLFRVNMENLEMVAERDHPGSLARMEYLEGEEQMVLM